MFHWTAGIKRELQVITRRRDKIVKGATTKNIEVGVPYE